MKQQQIDITSSAHSPGKIIWKLAWPVMLEQILIMMVQYVDTAMVGAIGPNATAAVALTSSTKVASPRKLAMRDQKLLPVSGVSSLSM